jgi:hypothetical protein
MLFHYPTDARERRHGPGGYEDYGSYKPWLRDEFEFRCVYCLCRERWFPDGDDSFSVDHVIPQREATELACDYDNLVYACCQCNSAKQDAVGVADPCREPYGTHLEVVTDGTIRGLSPIGDFLIQACRLDRPKLTEFRRGVLGLFRDLKDREGQHAAELRRRFSAFPSNLPNLSNLRPPAGNSRARGLTSSHFAQRQRGELRETY